MAQEANNLQKRSLAVSLGAAVLLGVIASLPPPRLKLGAESLRDAKVLAPISRATNGSWLKRHEDILAKASSGHHDVMLLGDSITQGWELNRVAWEQNMDHLPVQKVLNAGISSDRIEHILWRVKNGLFDTARPKVCVLMAGINNISMASPESIAVSIGQVMDEIAKLSPTTKILVLGILPSGKEAENPRRTKIKIVNRMLQQIVAERHGEFLDTGSRFLLADGTLPKSISFDGVHLTKQGYQIWAAALRQPLRKISRS